MRCTFRLLTVVLILCATLAHARVSRVEITSRADVLDGEAFGDVGAYERITGRVYYQLKVDNWHNSAIVDLVNAVNLKNGEVEFASDFIVVRPKDMAKGNGSMLLEVPNRGRSRIIGLVDGGDWDLAHNAGDGWLLRNGYTIAAVGWQWDAAGEGALGFVAPVAKERGKTIIGLLRGDFMLSKAAEDVPLGHLILGTMGGSEYPVSDPEDTRNVLTVRDSRNAPRTPIPRAQWKFAHAVDGKLTASDRFIHLDGGFQPGRIYEYVYAVADPVVAGAGFAAIRDFAAWSKNAPDAVAPVKRVYGEGISQNGRFLRDYLYQAFNGDEEGRMALDGVLAHVAGAGRGSFNYRFAQPSRDAQPTSSVFFPTDVFPFTDLPETDRAVASAKVKGGLLDRVAGERNVPKIFFSNTSYEYWGRAAALIHVVPGPGGGSGSAHPSAEGMLDAEISPYVRIYHFTGLQHFSVPFPPEKGKGDLLGQQPQSPLPVKYFWRAMITNMDAWVRSNTEPPPSSYPWIADQNLIPLEKYAFPKIPGVNVPHEANEAWRLDFGPDWRKTGILARQPPTLGQPFPVLVPQVDSDGNERDGVRLPEFAAPLATYAPWNLRDASIGAPEQRVSFEASWIPFAKTAADRQRTGDPRKSVEERYKSREQYVAKYTAALDELIKQRWILAEDRAAVLERGEQEWDFATK
ncbi:MAG TPA: alpha/beta hydrolase domain-containing protein [Terracidiphilus sp.]